MSSSPRGRTLRPAATALLLAPLLAGLGASDVAAQSQRSISNRVITADQITRSRAKTAWEALQRVVPHLSIGQNTFGTPNRIRWRGNPSMVVSSQPVIVVNGVKIQDLNVLSAMPAEIIASIRVMNAIDGTTLYGTGTASGVILIETKGGRPN